MRKPRTDAISNREVSSYNSRRSKIQTKAKSKRAKNQTNSLITIIGRPLYWFIIGLIFLSSLVTDLLSRILKFLFKQNNLIKNLFHPQNLTTTAIKKSATYIEIYNQSKIKSAAGFILTPFIYLSILKKYRLIFPIIFLFALVVLIICLAYPVWANLPDPEKLINRPEILTTKIYDRHGQLLYKIYRQENRSLVNLSDIPENLVKATIAIEDAEFYQHHGLSFKGIVRAAMANIRNGKTEGGSTITQQLVKNTLLSPEQTFTRKIREMILSLLVERKFSKNEILQMYLNEVGYGGAAYGVEEASQMYFGKSVRNLDLAESALLAGLPASPTRYSPFGIHPELARERQELVLSRMVEEGYITPQQKNNALSEKINFSLPQDTIKAPHFVMYVKDLLVQKYGERMVEEGGLEVTTSLDLNIQTETEKIVKEEVDKLKPLHISNGAALVTDPKNGQILAMVGSKNYFDQSIDGNVNVTLRDRQPGSTIKIVNYSVALQNGYSPSSIINDSPISFPIPGQSAYTPKNYDNHFHGNVSLRTALGSSYNVPAVKVLASYGVSKMVEMGQAMGITSWNDPSRFGLSLTLGGGEVKMIDLATVYGTVANEGVRVDPNPIIAVRTTQGHDITKVASPELLAANLSTINNPTTKKVLPPTTAYQLTDILTDNSARTPAFGPHSLLNIVGHPHIAVKTGTTTSMRDNWAIGYSPDFLVATWVGNNDNSPMSYVASGITGASPIWNKIMTFVTKDIPDKEFPIPSGLTKIKVCSLTNTLPCQGCPTKEELFEIGKEPKNNCNPEAIKIVLSSKTN